MCTRGANPTLRGESLALTSFVLALSCRPCLKSCMGFWSPSLLVFAQLSSKTPARRHAVSLCSGSDLHSPAALCCAEDLRTCLSTLQPHSFDLREDFSLERHYLAAGLAHLPTAGLGSVVKTRPSREFQSLLQ
ncbi:hypothetical protein GOODEAATRI_006845 [Goodea atripinnis]|uniref:Uncharacterized protein n=1 Tax=Goodea atripinnis TaxID=208336 RepID=A0ABV0PLM1_9TELE